MTNFTVRVELHGATSGQYEQLHEAMEAKGFVRWVKNGNGEKDQLPTAEYNMQDTGLTRDQVHARARGAADSVKPSPHPSILTTESAGRTWSGLTPWKAPVRSRY
ncbi:MAG: type V toxin-antitoxin system endoribonuclease antitoxin GhoS [Phenylobacterium sp.]|uniref:hypothetical protein n=1 Tax=Phenylobacterium sp. TaxID=1871053 RepID=UPI001A4D053A|nr:hypothetical protein [Phenylobacterium sp.]MBL8555077.1 type V toxin-antitoxin system endoribonuclease antitoxin GhoS [Phenylobacterium sp.]